MSITGFKRKAMTKPHTNEDSVFTAAPSAPVMDEKQTTKSTIAKHIAKVITVYAEMVVYLLFQSIFILGSLSFFLI